MQPAQGMVLNSKRRALSSCLLLSIFWISAMGIARADGSKHAVKTIKTEYGDVYDCVDFYKQPAFNHPLLKNHSFHPQMRPTSQPQRIRNSYDSLKINATAIDIAPFKDGGCPQGTVPIRRTNKSKVHPRQSSNATNPNGGLGLDYISGTIISISQTKSDPWKAYNGAGAVITVYKPRVLESQYSSAEIIIKGGTDTLILGWTVNPNKYPDRQTRFFIYSVAGDMHCFDTECGFVFLRSDLPSDFRIYPVSRRGEQVYTFKFFVHRDQTSGDWWLQVGSANPPITLGFWPQKIFTGLQKPATYVACGGEAYTIASMPPPEIGAGYYPGVAGHDAYCTNFVVVDDKNNIVDIADTEIYANNEFVYGAYDKGESDGRRSVLFGGPNPT